MSDEKQETIDDILAEMREIAIFATRFHNAEQAHLFATLSQRIEAAWKRERAKVEADALSVGGVVEAARTAEKSSAVGNAAAMREALERLRTEIERFYNNEWIPYDAWQGCDDVISHALSASARNCDRFTSIEEARTAYCSECGRMISIWDGNESWLFEEWLFAPAAERKGE